MCDKCAVSNTKLARLETWSEGTGPGAVAWRGISDRYRPYLILPCSLPAPVTEVTRALLAGQLHQHIIK